MNKLLIAVQYCPLDKDMGEALLRLIADLEEKKCDTATILFSTRYDMDPDPELVRYVSRRFDVLTHRSRRKADGWPAGPNAQFADTYSAFVNHTKSGTKGWNFDYCLFLEADDVPMRRGWHEEIRQEAYLSGKMVIGPWLKPMDCGHEHINGNCVIHKDFWRKCRQVFTPPSSRGWDVAIKHDMMRNGHPSKLIYSDYRLGTTDNPWKSDEHFLGPRRYLDPSNALYGQDLYPSVLHGCKTTQGLDAVRKKLLTAAT